MKKTILRKYYNIAFPIFVLRKKPYAVTYESSKIYCQKTADSKPMLLDDKSIKGDYFNRLLSMPYRTTFDATCKDLQALLWTNYSWGMDANAMPHDFSKKEKVPAEKRLVTKITGNLFWLRNISYPFEIPTNENISLTDKLYATIIYVNGGWYITEFSLSKELKLPYKMV